jgi:hypothetical protein
MARLDFCRGSAEPRWKKKIARNTMKIAEPHHQTRLLNEFCMALCIEAVEGGGINAPPIIF